MLRDKKSIIEESVVYHGKMNDRIYLVEYGEKDGDVLIKKLNQLATENQYGKIIAKVPESKTEKFLCNGYEIEAKIPGYYKNGDVCFFVAKYFDKNRKQFDGKDKIINSIENIKNEIIVNPKIKIPSKFLIKELTTNNTEAMVEIFRKVFITYPFPIHDKNYLLKTMREHTVYFGAFCQDKLIGVSSCEINNKDNNVEMTDFAILSEYRGNQIASQLLKEMEKHMIKHGIQTAYTIARTISVAMNKTFASAEYINSGILWQNTQIAGQIESMSVWYKPLITS